MAKENIGVSGLWGKIVRFTRKHRLFTALLIVVFIGAAKLAFEEMRSMDTLPNEGNTDFEKKIAPFSWAKYEGSFSLCLYVAERYKTNLFTARSNEGFRGNGYDWESLAEVFLEEKMPELKGVIDFDSEAGMFCAYSSDSDALAKFAVAFKDACEDDALIRDLFSRAGTDHIMDEATMMKAYEDLFGENGLLSPKNDIFSSSNGGKTSD